jgi:hypothetical protein
MSHKSASSPISTIGIGAVVLHTNIEPGLPKRGLNGIMRSTIAACTILVLLIGTVDAEHPKPRRFPLDRGFLRTAHGQSGDEASAGHSLAVARTRYIKGRQALRK